MLACFQKKIISIPKHMAIKPPSSCLQSPQSIIKLIQWCLFQGVSELTFFAGESGHKLLAFVMQQKPVNTISWHLISTNNDIDSNIRVKLYQLRTPAAALQIYFYLDYDFRKNVENQFTNNFTALMTLPSAASEPDVLVVTDAVQTLVGTCLHRLEKTKIMFIGTKMIHCDDEVWNDCLEHYSDID